MSERVPPAHVLRTMARKQETARWLFGLGAVVAAAVLVWALLWGQT